MRIKLAHFNNLASVDYEIENEKINFLFGISGSGKSSIAKSVNVTNASEYVTIGQPPESCSVFVSDPPYPEGETIPIYDFDYMDRILIQKASQSDVYSILFAGEDENSMTRFRNQYDLYLGGLKTSKDQLLSAKNTIDTLAKALKIAFNKDRKTYKSTCLLRKFEATVTSKRRNTLAQRYAGNRARWFAEGRSTEEFALGRCPFCSKKLTDSRKRIIDEITSIDIDAFEKINAQLPVFRNLNIELPVWSSKTSTNKFKKRLQDVLEAEKEIDALLGIIDASYQTEPNINDIKKIRLRKKVTELFPTLSEAIDTFNNSLSEAKAVLGGIKKKTTAVISRNVRTINDFLHRCSVPYIFEKTEIDRGKQRVTYVLRHKDDTAILDRTKGLSFGERNIVGLILFLLANKSRSMYVIDDPASSFDDLRRQIILDLILENKQPSSTVLVLSHDEIFVKLALLRAKQNHKFAKSIGRTTFLEHNRNATLSEISFSDFGPIDVFIKNRLSQLPRVLNYQTASLIRMLFENRPEPTKATYRYLSAIIHEMPYSEIENRMSQSSFTEEEVLESIQTAVGEPYEPLSPSYLSEYKKLSYDDFEFLVLARESLRATKDRSKKAIKAELDGIVHLNATSLTCLNPFKFRLYSIQTHDFLSQEKERFLTS